jgi:hypothetical protein
MNVAEYLKSRIEEYKVSLALAEKAALSATQKVSQLKDKISAYQKTLKAEMEINGHTVVAEDSQMEEVPEEPIKTEFVLDLIRKSPTSGVKPKTILAKCEAAGINLSRNYVYTIVARLKEKGRITEQDGKYFPVTQEEERSGESPAATAAELEISSLETTAAVRMSGPQRKEDHIG